DASYSENLLRSYLTHEIGGRYDQPPSIAKPIPGTVEFQVGTPGTSVSLDQAIILIENALFSSTNRTVSLPLGRTSPARPSLQNLQILLQQTIDLAGYDGLAGIYLQDMQTGQELHMLYSNGAVIPKTPDVSFTAASIIKIPIMVSVFRRMGENQDSEALKLLDEMITKSGNDPADWLMEQYVDPIRGPLEVTADMRALGLQSTFMTGLFRFGAPPLAVYNTPGNSRNDINTEPDIYNQTSVSEIGMLLADIYQCAETGGGALVAVFGNEITQRECQQMIELLANNFLPDLISGGVPDGIRVAHKHGWIQNNLGTINPIGDAGIVFTPSGNYVLVMYFYHPVEILYNPIAAIMRDLSRAIYNYYNLPSP
ncbi:MAG: class A beta-lactamase-related serine hydrolase, partial [Anaerolineae bacterium]|nr:class A beta-lactamase-related serine hydrolase [Anaerolineae bacterium]